MGLLDPPALARALASETGLALLGGTAASSRRTLGVAESVPVSKFVPLYGTYQAAIHAAIGEAATKPGGVVDFEGIHYVTTGTVTVGVGVTLANGGIVPTGEFNSLRVNAAYVTVRNMRFSRSTSHSVTADSQATRSNVVVKGANFHSFDSHYVGANQSCIYLDHALANGAVISGGSISGAATRQGSAGVQAASGSTGNRNITVRDVQISNCNMGIFMFDTGDSLVANNRITSCRRLPTITLTGWTLVSGNVYRTLDRTDGATNVIHNNGVEINVASASSTAPGANLASTSDGYVYLNLNGTDPNTRTITSNIVSGYGLAMYTLLATCSRNRFSGNYIEDTDGFGIYLQLGDNIGGTQNIVSDNTLVNVCLTGRQTISLVWAGIGVFGGSDTSIIGGTVDGVGSSGTPVPGAYLMSSANSFIASGKVVGLVVRNATEAGFYIRSSGWSLVGCEAYANGLSGFRIYKAGATDVVHNIVLTGCIAAYNTTDGFYIGGIDGTGYVSAQIIGGSAHHNTNRGVLIDGPATDPAVRNCSVIALSLSDNGSPSIPQMEIRDKVRKITVADCHMFSSSPSRTGLTVGADPIDVSVSNNHYDLATPESFATTVNIGGTIDAQIARSAAGRITVAGSEIITAAAIAAVNAKATPVDTDTMPLFDSEAGGVPKRWTWANLKAALKSYYDSATSTLTNKSVDLGTNTITGTKAQFNAALTDADFATLTGTETVQNKTLDDTNSAVLKDNAFTLERNLTTSRKAQLLVPPGQTASTTRQHILPGVNSNLLFTTGTVPASATATGEKNQIEFDGSFAYFCTATNTWVRVAIATW